ncbi:MAG: two-component system response regulator PhoP [Rhodoferax sp.]
MRLLLVEDDATLLRNLSEQLQAQGYQVQSVADGAEAWYWATEFAWDVAVIDLGLPKLSGMDLIRRLRSQGWGTPVLILTARGHWQDKVLGLEAGADDYLVKPFEFPELAARLKALLRRAVAAAPDGLRLGPLHLDFERQQVTLDGLPLALTAFEYRLLELLVRAKGRPVSKSTLADALYPHDTERDSNVIEVLVARLRRKLDANGQNPPIETLRGRGYRWLWT